eukprot:jgi/Galph1/4091/GphlegSOOS_G2770.1
MKLPCGLKNNGISGEAFIQLESCAFNRTRRALSGEAPKPFLDKHVPNRINKNCRLAHVLVASQSQDKPPFKDASERILQRSFDTFLQELAAIRNYKSKCLGILGTRQCSLLHQQIVELVSYASLLVGNHLYTSGGIGTNAAAIRGALRAKKPHQLTVVLPQSRKKQPEEILSLLNSVENIVEMPHNDELPLEVASRLCNSFIISKCDELISFAFHDSLVVLEAVNETKALKKLVTLFYLD